MSIVDSSPKPKTVNLNNGATISTLRSRFGGGSLYLNNGAYASVGDHTDFGFGTGDFTIELWVYAYENVNWRTLVEVGTYSSGLLWRMGTGGDNLYINNSQYNWNPGNVPINNWTHLALVRINGTIKVYINGTESLSVGNGSDLGASKPVYIGGRSNGNETFNGFIDEIRVTKGISSARYSSNFDVKTLYAPFPSSGTPVSPPNVPTNLIAGGLDQTINMIWDTPAEDNGGIITDYNIQYSTDGTNWTTFDHPPSTITAISVTGLTNSTTYSVRVGAVNLTGIGTYASQSDLIPTVPAVDTNPDPYFYNTSLLLHFDGSHNSTTITDVSYLPKTASVQGDAKISIARNKFGGSSLRLDGSGDYISYPPHPGFDFNNEDFTIEFWAYCQDQNVSYPTYIANQGGWYEGSFGIRFDNTGSQRFGVYWNPGDPLIQSNNTFGFNQWRHVAVVRQGTTVRLYVDGNQEGTASISSSRTLDLCMGGSMRIGFSTWDGGNGYVNDYIDDLRITRGVCRYPDGTSFSLPSLPFSDVAPAITPPTAPSNITVSGGDASAIVSWSGSSSDKTIRVNYEVEYSENVEPRSWTTVNTTNTKLLLHFNKTDIRGNATLVDSSLYGREVLWNPTGPAIVGGASSPGTFQKFGTGCLEIPYNRTGYTSPYIIKVAEASDLNPGTGNYTLEMFINSDYSWGSGKYANGVGRLFGSYNGSSGSYFALWSSGGYNGSHSRIAKFVNGSDVYGVTFTNGELNANTENWGVGQYNAGLKHLAFCRHNGTMRIYLNGSKILETADTNNDIFAHNGLVIMGGESGSHNPNNYVIGRIDELRYTLGEALYTGSSIDLLPSAEFKNAKITGIPNDKNYVFRVRGQNSAGYGDYSGESSSTLVATPPSLSISVEPLNTRVETYNGNAVFSASGVISDASSPTYQWQGYSYDPNGNACDDFYNNVNKEWRNISGATSSSLTINNSYFPYCYAQSSNNPVRCVISSPYETKVSKVVRIVDISSAFSDYSTYRYEYNIDANYRASFELYNYGGYYGNVTDYSWYTGADTKVRYQYSSNNSTWTYTDPSYDQTFRKGDNYYQVFQIPPIDLSGTVYVRIILQDIWPYNTTNGSSSSIESPYNYIVNTFEYPMNATPPASPTNFAALGGNELVALSWTKVHSGGQPSTATYTIEYSEDNSNWTTFTSTLPFNNNGIYVTNLTNGTLYYFRLKLVNSIGETSWTSSVTATPNLSAAVAPSAPTNLFSIAGDGRAYLAWNTPPSDGRSPLTGYNIQYSIDNGATWIDYVETP